MVVCFNLFISSMREYRVDHYHLTNEMIQVVKVALSKIHLVNLWSLRGRAPVRLMLLINILVHLNQIFLVSDRSLVLQRIALVSFHRVWSQSLLLQHLLLYGRILRVINRNLTRSKSAEVLNWSRLILLNRSIEVLVSNLNLLRLQSLLGIVRKHDCMLRKWHVRFLIDMI